MHSATKEQREAVRQLVHSVITADMGNFNPDRFKDWIKYMDGRFQKVAMKLGFTISGRRVTFTVKEIRSRRTVFRFGASTSVRFDDSDVSADADTLIRAS